MPTPVAVILGLFAVVFAYVVYQMSRAGPGKLAERDLARAVVVKSATRDRPGTGWEKLGSRTKANGLDLLFEADDDPEAEASFFVDNNLDARSTLANRVTIQLKPEFETHHVHTRGWIFRVRVRGTERVVGHTTRVQMNVRTDGTPACGRIENDDDDARPAMGGWIEFESLEILKTGR